MSQLTVMIVQYYSRKKGNAWPDKKIFSDIEAERQKMRVFLDSLTEKKSRT
jgi:hypothetical protein